MIATVLLIAMVIVIGLLIFSWARGFQEEAVTKFGGENIELVCGDVTFEADYSVSEGKLFLSNFGNVPIFQIKAKIEKDGSSELIGIEEISGANWPNLGLPQGSTFSGDVGSSFSGAKKILLIPALRGISGKGERIHICDDQFGKEIQV